jgi:hypothetical protein
VLFVAECYEVNTRQVNPFLDGADIAENANFTDVVSLLLEPVKDFTSFLETSLACN